MDSLELKNEGKDVLLIARTPENLKFEREISPVTLHNLKQRACPGNLSEDEKERQALERIRACDLLFGSDVTEKILIDGSFFWGTRLTTGEEEPEELARIWITFSRQGCEEGDFALTLLYQPDANQSDTIRIASVGFIMTTDVVTITNIQGPPSTDNTTVTRKFGIDFAKKQRLYERCQNTLKGAKPFSFLLGLMLEIALAKKIPTVRGVSNELLPQGIGNYIKHDLRSIYYTIGLRSTDATHKILETKLVKPEDREKCFARITGRAPAKKIPRERVFQTAKIKLESVCPFLFDEVRCAL